MQELIEYLNGDSYAGICDIRDRAEELLEKEKEQLIDKWKKGFDDAKYIYTPPPLYKNNQTYDGVNLHRFIKDEFDQTYNQNK